MNDLHHANLLIAQGDPYSFIASFARERLGFEPKANPDFLLVDGSLFGIDEARRLEEWALGKPLLGEVKVCAVISDSITFEAQNALLKVLEEPPLGTYIFLALPSLGGLLPTFLSRIRILEGSFSGQSKDKSLAKAEKFLKESVSGRLSMVRSLSKKEDRAELQDLLSSLERAYHEAFLSEPRANRSQNMEKILMAKIFASGRGSSPKMLIEWLSCML